MVARLQFWVSQYDMLRWLEEHLAESGVCVMSGVPGTVKSSMAAIRVPYHRAHAGEVAAMCGYQRPAAGCQAGLVVGGRQRPGTLPLTNCG